MNQKKLFQKDFTLVVIGQIISLFGNAILRFALPLYLLRETGSATLFGVVTACSFLPVIVLSLLGGVLADRVNKRNIMVALDFSTAALMFLFALLLGRLPVVALLLVTLMLLYGIQGIYQPAVQASIPAIVPEAQLLAGNAVINQVSALSGLLGPVIGGVLYGLFGIQPILAVSIVCFFISAVMEIFIRIPYQKRETAEKAFTIVKGDLKESFCYMKSERPEFIAVAVIIALFNLFLSAAIIIGLPVVLVECLEIDDNLFGLSQGIMAFGGLAGGAAAGALGKRLRIDKAHVSLFVCAGSVLPMGLVMMLKLPVMVCFVVITLMCFVCMAGSTVFMVQMFSYAQEKTPQLLVGKVISVLMVIGMCSQPLGQAMYGFLFDLFSQNPGIVLALGALAGCTVAVGSARVFANIGREERGLVFSENTD